MAGVSLGFLACLAVAGATARSLSHASPEMTCPTASACNELGVSHSSGSAPGAPDVALAARLFQRACDQGHAQGCNNLGLAYLAAKGVPEDYGTAMTYFGRACSGGFAEGCNNQGALYEHGQGVPVNLGDAQRLYAQACRHGSALGCSNLGVLYAEGRGVAVNYGEAARLFAEACSGGSAVGCKNLSDSQPSPSASPR